MNRFDCRLQDIAEISEKKELDAIRARFLRRYCPRPYRQPIRIPAHYAVQYIEGEGVRVEAIPEWDRPYVDHPLRGA